MGYAPFEDPEIVVVAFMYNAGEGSQVALPVVRKVLDAYFRPEQYQQPLESASAQ